MFLRTNCTEPTIELSVNTQFLVPDKGSPRLPCWLRWQRIYLQCRRPQLSPWVEKIPWPRKWQPTPVFSPGEFHGWRAGRATYRPWGCKELGTTEWLTLSLFTREEELSTRPMSTSQERCLNPKIKTGMYSYLEVANELVIKFRDLEKASVFCLPNAKYWSKETVIQEFWG